MTKKFKILSLVAIGSSMVLGTVALAATGAFKKSIFPAKAESFNRSIVFSKDSAKSYSSVSGSASGLYINTIKKDTAGGNEITCTVNDSTTSISSSSNIGNLREISKLSFSSAYALAGKPFQAVSSISVASASTAARSIRIYYNGSETYDTLSVPARSSATLDTSSRTVKSFEIKYPGGSEYNTIAVVSVTINYTCSTDYSDDTALDSISLSGQTTSYTVNGAFSFDGVVTAHYTDLTSNVVTPTSITTPDMTTVGAKTVTVSYTEGGITKTASYSITVSEAASGLSGTYAGTYSLFTFTDGTHGSYTYSTYTIYFTYTVSGTSVTFTYDSGNNDDFGNYKLFNGSATVNSTGSLNSDSSKLTVTTYGIGSTNRTFTKQ